MLYLPGIDVTGALKEQDPGENARGKSFILIFLRMPRKHVWSVIKEIWG